MKRYWVLLLCLCLMPSGAAWAQTSNDSASKQDVQQLFELMHSRTMLASMVGVLKKQSAGFAAAGMSAETAKFTPQERKQMQQFMQEQLDKTFASLPLNEMLEAMQPVYQKHFTHAEMQDLIRFYSTSTGQKLITEMPAITSEYMKDMQPILQKWMAQRSLELQRSAEAYAKKLHQKKDADTPATKSPKSGS